MRAQQDVYQKSMTFSIDYTLILEWKMIAPTLVQNISFYIVLYRKIFTLERRLSNQLLE